jgi:hypothetical protein
MQVRYTLNLDDHLAWFDYYCTTDFGRHEKSRLPFFGKYLDRISRESFGRSISTSQNKLAFGERTLELSAKGPREFGTGIDFITAWPDIALVAVTDTHLFIAHTSMNAHIIPLRSFGSEADRIAFVRHAESRGALIKTEPNQSLQTTTMAVTDAAAQPPRQP